MTIRAGAKIEAADFSLPTIATGFGNGTNTVTGTTFTNLPTNACTAAITNPHPTANMICLVTWGAWMSASANAIRCCPAVSGSIAIAAGIGVGGPIGWGEVPMSGSSSYMHHAGSATYALPASATAATFTMQAMRDSASGTQQVDYATIRIIPLRFDV